MKTTMKFLGLGFIILGLAFTSCSKDGEIGPIGPAGPQGEQGIQGALGANGEDGEDGNANVFASDWLEPTESSYSVNNPRYKALPIANGLSQSVISEGVILVYFDNDVEVNLLPQHSFFNTGNIYKSVDSHINHASRTIHVTIERYDTDLTPREYLWDSSAPAYNKGVRFRYVIIPSSTSAKNSSPDFKNMSFAEVMDHLGLEY